MYVLIRDNYRYHALQAQSPDPVVRACGMGSPTDHPTLLLALLGYYDPEDDGQGIGRGGRRTQTGTGDVKAADRTAGSSRARARGATTKILFH